MGEDDRLVYKRWAYNGIPDPPDTLAKLLTKDKRRFKDAAQVVYRCRKCGKLLGFAYPVVMLASRDETVDFGQFNDDGHLMVNEPEYSADAAGRIVPARPEPFGPWTLFAPLMPGRVYKTWWFFSYRNIDPEFQFEDPLTGDVAWSSARGVKGYQPGQSAPAEVLDSSSPGDISVVGKRHVWNIVDGYRWAAEEKAPPLFSRSNPAGLINCKDHEQILTFSGVEADMKIYQPGRSINLPK